MVSSICSVSRFAFSFGEALSVVRSFFIRHPFNYGGFDSYLRRIERESREAVSMTHSVCDLSFVYIIPKNFFAIHPEIFKITLYKAAFYSAFSI